MNSGEKIQIRKGLLIQLLKANNSKVICRCQLDEIKFYAIKAKVPINLAEKILNTPEEIKRITDCKEIRYIYNAPQLVKSSVRQSREEMFPPHSKQKNLGKPILALFDGLPIENHTLIKNHLEIHDLHGVKDNYSSKARKHGTAMSSIIINGDLNGEEEQIPKRIFVIPIYKGLKDDEEGLPENKFIEDIIHKNVLYLVNERPEIKMVNLSFGDMYYPFVTKLSPFARLLDYLSVKYNFLFLVSAGNNKHPLNLGMTETDFKSLSEDNKIKKIFQSLRNSSKNRGLISPSESINALTIGAFTKR